MLPVFENISGTINAAVIVGEMSAIFCASNSTKLRQCGLSRDSMVWFIGVFLWAFFRLLLGYFWAPFLGCLSCGERLSVGF